MAGKNKKKKEKGLYFVTAEVTTLVNIYVNAESSKDAKKLFKSGMSIEFDDFNVKITETNKPEFKNLEAEYIRRSKG